MKPASLLIFFLFFSLLACNPLADKVYQIKAAAAAANAKNTSNIENTNEKNTFFKNFCTELGKKIKCMKEAPFGDPNQICLQTHWTTDEDLVKKFNQHTSINTQEEVRKNTTETRETLEYSDFRTTGSFKKAKEGFINVAHKLEEIISKNEYPECEKIVKKEL